MSGDSFFDRYLPDSFDHVVANVEYYDAPAEFVGSEIYFHAVLRANLSTPEDVVKWLNEFERKTNTKWIVSRTHPEMTGHRILYRRHLVCELADPKAAKRHREEEEEEEHSGCPSTLDIKIKTMSTFAKKRDELMAKGLQAVIELHFVHYHDIKAESVVRPLPEVEAAYEAYFEQGMNPKEAHEFHEGQLAESPGLSSEEIRLLLNDPAQNPPLETVKALHSNCLNLRPKYDPLALKMKRGRKPKGASPPRKAVKKRDLEEIPEWKLEEPGVVRPKVLIKARKKGTPLVFKDPLLRRGPKVYLEEAGPSDPAMPKLDLYEDGGCSGPPVNNEVEVFVERSNSETVNNEDYRVEIETVLAEKMGELDDSSVETREAMTVYLQRLGALQTTDQMIAFLQGDDSAPESLY